MCLGIPGKIESLVDDDSPIQSGIVSFGGLKKQIVLAYVPEAREGDYVIVHVGFAISKIDEEEALRVFEHLEKIGELGEL